MLKELPSYTTERYYVLSELEERAKVHHLWNEEDGNSLNSTILDILNGSTIKVLYLLWNLNDKSSTEKVKKILEKSFSFLNQTNQTNDGIVHHQYQSGHIALVVEVLLSQSTTDWSVHGSNEETVVREMMNWIITNYQNQVFCINFGMCNNTAGTPALSSILDLLNMLNRRSSYNIKKGEAYEDANIIGITEASFLGHDITREPEAASDVYQLQLSSLSPEDLSQFIDSYLQIQMKNKNKIGAEGRNHKEKNGNENDSNSSSSILWLWQWSNESGYGNVVNILFLITLSIMTAFILGTNKLSLFQSK